MKSGGPPSRPRGQPLVALMAIPLCWIALRIAVESPVMPSAAARQQPAPQTASGSPLPQADFQLPQAARAANRVGAGPRHASRDTKVAVSPVSFKPDIDFTAISRVRLEEVRSEPQSPAYRGAEALQSEAMPHVALLTARERPQELAPRRWSADAWLAVRQNGAPRGAGRAAVPLYGASQAGAVVRFDLAAGARHRPAAYVRAVKALAGIGESDLAAGVSARPLADVPLTAHVEARLSSNGERTQLRPAAFVAAGFEDAALPMSLRARGYAQAGYVGGRDATGFADGSLVAERALLQSGDSEFSAGAGAWCGAQRGASRLDIGPSASLRLPLGTGSARVAIDYRWRVAGNAAPASGAALTLSAGF